MFLNDRQVDNSRSGLELSFEQRDYLDQLERELGSDFPDPTGEMMGRMSALDPKLLAARQVAFLDEYLRLKNTPGYASLYKDATYVADSLAGYDPIEFDDRSKELVEVKRKLTQLDNYYRRVLPQVQSVDFEERQEAGPLISSVRETIGEEREKYVKEALRRSDKLSGFQKMLLLTKRFSLGNTHLANDGSTTVGLPIRGINYAYERGLVSAEIQYGKRIASRRFVPRDGIPFHDLVGAAKFGRLAIGVGHRKKSFYEFSLLTGQENSQAGSSRLPSTVLPRRNRVVTLAGQTHLGEALTVNSLISHADTRQAGALPDSASGDAAASVSHLNLRVGGSLSLPSMEIEVAAFRTGADYLSLANPYLYTDYQGLEASVLANNLGDKLTARFSIAVGFGTEAATSDNIRLRARGQLRYRINPHNALLLIVSPNVYRYEVTGKEGLSESSIYQLSYQKMGDLFDKPGFLSLGVTNLNQGLTWTDTTTSSRSILLTGNAQLELSDHFVLGLDILQSFSDLTDGARDWAYGITATVPAKVRFTTALRYDQYRYEAAPAFGANLEIGFPLGRLATVQVSVFYRPVRQSEDDQPSGISELFSQQSWEARF